MPIIYSSSIVSVADAQITPRTETSGYSDENVMDFWHLKKRFRADDVTANDYLLKFDFGAAQVVAGIFLNDVNFNLVKIQGHATDSWSSPSFAGTDIAVSLNYVTGRYQAYIPLTGFNYRWMRIFIPTGAGAVGAYTTKWEVGAVCPLSAVTELSYNMDFGYTYNAEMKHQANEKANGGPDIGEISDIFQWKGQVIFGDREGIYENELWTLNRVKPSTPLIFYENEGDTSRAYLCHKSNFLTGSISGYNRFAGGIMKLVELI